MIFCGFYLWFFVGLNMDFSPGLALNTVFGFFEKRNHGRASLEEAKSMAACTLGSMEPGAN